MVAIKLLVLGMFVIVAAGSFTGSHFDNFAPHGLAGVREGASVIFFAYIGFDAVSTASGEAKDPGKSLPIAIIGSLVIATIIYIIVALAAVGALPAEKLTGSDAPLSDALRDGAGVGWAADIVSFGAMVAITSVVLTVLFGQTRITVAMGRDGLLPPIFARVSKTRGTPIVATALFAVLISALAAFLPLSELAKLVNIGTLFAFLIVNAGVIILRRTKPDLERRFRVPFVPFTPIIGGALCLYLMTTLPAETWARFAIWMVLGLTIYFFYGRSHSKLRR
jgi:APA family basic amino acid/polyamine antiporter